MNIVQQAAEKISQEMISQFVGIQNQDVNFTELVENIQSCVHEIGVSMIEALIIEADSALRQSSDGVKSERTISLKCVYF